MIPRRKLFLSGDSTLAIAFGPSARAQHRML